MNPNSVPMVVSSRDPMWWGLPACVCGSAPTVMELHYMTGTQDTGVLVECPNRCRRALVKAPPMLRNNIPIKAFVERVHIAWRDAVSPHQMD